jgi:two-component system CheB/CheR fusion protein
MPSQSKEELQATNEELETTNEELRARTAELQELTTMLESERVQLAEMVELAPFYILVLRGPSLVIEAYNPRYMPILGEHFVHGRPLAEVYDLFWPDSRALVQMAQEVYQQDSQLVTPRMLVHLPETDGEDEDHYFVFTLVPSHDVPGRITGVIIYAADEAEQVANT